MRTVEWNAEKGGLWWTPFYPGAIHTPHAGAPCFGARVSTSSSGLYVWDVSVQDHHKDGDLVLFEGTGVTAKHAQEHAERVLKMLVLGGQHGSGLATTLRTTALPWDGRPLPAPA